MGARRRSYPLPKPPTRTSAPPKEPTPEELEAEAKRKAELEAELAPWLTRAEALWRAGLPAGLYSDHAWEGTFRPGCVEYELRQPGGKWGSIYVETAYPSQREPKDKINVNGPTPCLDAETFADAMTVYRDIEKIVAHIKGALAALPMPPVKERA